MKHSVVHTTIFYQVPTFQRYFFWFGSNLLLLTFPSSPPSKNCPHSTLRNFGYRRELVLLFWFNWKHYYITIMTIQCSSLTLKLFGSWRMLERSIFSEVIIFVNVKGCYLHKYFGIFATVYAWPFRRQISHKKRRNGQCIRIWDLFFRFLQVEFLAFIKCDTR